MPFSRLAAVQTEYSLMERDAERNGVLAACEELGIGFVPWGPVGMGYLTGKMDARTKLDPKTDLRAGFDRFSPENLAANRPIVDAAARDSRRRRTPHRRRSALAWLLAQKPLIVPIPGTRNIDHLRENLGAINVQLTPADLREIDDGALQAHGARWPDERDADEGRRHGGVTSCRKGHEAGRVDICRKYAGPGRHGVNQRTGMTGVDHKTKAPHGGL